MNSKKAYEIGISIFDLRERNKGILEYIKKIGAKYEEFQTFPNNILSLPTDQNAAARVRDLQGKINNLTSETLTIVRSIPPFKFIPDANIFINDLRKLNELSENTTLNELLTNEISVILEEHTHAYAEKNFTKVNKFSHICYGIHKKLYLLEYLASTLVTLGEREQYDKDQYEVFEIYIEQNEQSVVGLGILLLSLHKLYSFLLKITEEGDDNLEYFKIETGSKWLRFLGKKEALVLLTLLITKSSDIVIEVIKNRIPSESVRERISNSSALLDLLEKSKKSGLSEKEMEIIKKAYIASILQISAGTKEIKLGNESIVNVDSNEADTKKLNKEAMQTFEIE